MLRMRNDWLKAQYNWEPNTRLSNLYVSYSCIPFDEMPFCTAPRAHNPRFWDLMTSLDLTGRTHELLARRVQRNVEDRGVLYTPVDELEDLGDVRRPHRHLQPQSLLQASARQRPRSRQGSRLHPGATRTTPTRS